MIDVFEMVAEFTVAVMYIVVIEPERTVKAGTVERALETEAVTEENEDIEDKADTEDATSMIGAGCKGLKNNAEDTVLVKAVTAGPVPSTKIRFSN